MKKTYFAPTVETENLKASEIICTSIGLDEKAETTTMDAHEVNLDWEEL